MARQRRRLRRRTDRSGMRFRRRTIRNENRFTVRVEINNRQRASKRRNSRPRRRRRIKVGRVVQVSARRHIHVVSAVSNEHLHDHVVASVALVHRLRQQRHLALRPNINPRRRVKPATIRIRIVQILLTSTVRPVRLRPDPHLRVQLLLASLIRRVTLLTQHRNRRATVALDINHERRAVN